jgi:CelD/BcsL family acetyltransferase involved in cellulose biosynthesis
MAHAISSAIAEGATGFDFLRGDEPYKTQWGAELRHDRRILLPAGARGRLLFAARSLARAVTGRA